MKYDIVTIGDAFEDVFVEPDLSVKSDARMASGKGICFEFGEKIPLNWIKYEIGGSACNTAVGFARLGLKTAIVTVLGDDTPRDKIIERLRDEDVDSSFANIVPEIKTGFSVVFSIKGERTIFMHKAIKDFKDFKIKKSVSARWYYIAPLGQNTGDIEKRMIGEVSEHGALLAWNPGAVQIEEGASAYRHLLNCCSILILNRSEAHKFVDFPVHPKPVEVMKKLQNLGPKLVVITDGKNGAKAYDGHAIYEVPANTRVDVVDSTGAGDAFAVGFVSRLIDCNFKEDLSPKDIKDALGWGIKNSSSVIRFVGGQEGLLRQGELH